MTEDELREAFRRDMERMNAALERINEAAREALLEWGRAVNAAIAMFRAVRDEPAGGPDDHD